LPPRSRARSFGHGPAARHRYRIVAGDASPEFRLTVVSAPTIIVDRLHYQFPPYTKRAAETAVQHGDIRALEGTKVTIHAIANQPIKSAWIEFDPAADDSALERVQLAAEGSRASGTITLQLKPDRQTPWHGAYQVRFYNERGQRSRQPILHKIDVIRDLAPEVQVLQPERLRVEVPADGEQKIEVRAVDPDFGLSRLRIEGTVGGRPAVSIDLLQAESGQPPQTTVPFLLRSHEHKLKAGDELRMSPSRKTTARVRKRTARAERRPHEDLHACGAAAAESRRRSKRREQAADAGR
jgi:hypothetical protein